MMMRSFYIGVKVHIQGLKFKTPPGVLPAWWLVTDEIAVRATRENKMGDFEKTTIKNYTPHVVNYFDEQHGCTATFEPEGVPVRVNENINQSFNHPLYKEEWDVVEKEYTTISGLPEEDPDVFLIVSIIVLNANKASPNPRKDLICPDTGPSCVRKPNGQVLGVRSFQV